MRRSDTPTASLGVQSDPTAELFTTGLIHNADYRLLATGAQPAAVAGWVVVGREMVLVKKSEATAF